MTTQTRIALFFAVMLGFCAGSAFAAGCAREYLLAAQSGLVSIAVAASWGVAALTARKKIRLGKPQIGTR